MKTEQKLKKIAKILDQYEKDIQEALDNDCEVNLGGNGINCCEANATFKPLAEEIRDVIELS